MMAMQPVRWSITSQLFLIALLASGGALLAVACVATLTPIRPPLLAVMVGCLTVAIAFAIWYSSKRFISDPLHHLAATCRKLSETDNVSARVDGRPGSDEAVLLIDSFNRLLDQREQFRANYDTFVRGESARQEEAIAARTRELQQTNEQLHAAATAAREAHDKTNQVIADMTHELRTPMNGVMGMAELLFTTELTQQQLGYTRTILESSEDLLALVNNILDFSKVEAGKLERIDSQPFSPGDCVEKVCRLLAVRAEMKGLTLTYEGLSELPCAILGDRKRLRQVLVNTIGNAIKFTETGTVVVRTTLVEQSGDVSTIRFEVVDTGIGIPTHLHEHVFEKFSQVDRSTTRQFGGAGLGLSISRHIVQLMKGEIGVVSQPGVGSNFWFTIKGEHRRPATAADSDLAGVHALVVATGASEHALRHELARCHATCRTARDSKEAIEVLQAEAHDVVLIDMPSPGNVEIARDIHSMEAARSVPLVLVSTIERGRNELKAVGVNGSIRKPLKHEEFFPCVARVTGRLDVVLPPDDRNSLDPDVVRAMAGAKILVADDHAVNREVTTTLLRTLKCRVDVAVDGTEVVDAVQREEYDLVLLDCEMPKLDGYDAAVEIRRLEQHGQLAAGASSRTREHLPIVAVTAHTSPRDRSRSLKSGMDDFVCKPFTLRTLRTVLAKWLDTAGGSVGDGASLPRVVSPDLAAEAPPPSATPATTSTDAPAISEEAIAQILELDRLNGGGVFARFAQTFLESVPVTLDQLRGAVRNSDCGGIARSAHALTGASLNIGAEPMATLSGELRALAESGTTEGASSLVARLDDLYVQVKAALESRLGKNQLDPTCSSSQ